MRGATNCITNSSNISFCLISFGIKTTLSSIIDYKLQAMDEISNPKHNITKKN